MNLPPLRVAVIGVGALGRHHARILNSLENTKLIAVADPSEEQGKAVAEACGCEWTHDYRTLFDQVDAVSIVVPTFLHRKIAEDFLSRSIPALIEKPLTAKVEDGAVLVRLAAEHEIPLQVGHIERFNPAFQQVQEWVEGPKYIRAERVSPYAFRSMDIGAVHDLMIHDLELVLTLTGEMPSNVSAMGVTLLGGHEDVVQARLTFPSGCVADVTANRVAPNASRKIQVWSRSGCVNADLHTREVERFTPGEPMLAGQLPYFLASDRVETIDSLKPKVFGHFIQTEEFGGSEMDALTAELESFLDCVRFGKQPHVDGVAALQALKVAELVLQAVDQHQWEGTPNGAIGPQALLQSYLGDADQAAA